MKSLLVLILTCAACFGQADYTTLLVAQAPVVASVATNGTNFITSYSGGSTANNFSGEVGFVILTGAQAFTITHLGRWVYSGNSQTHALKVRNNACSELASVTVNCSGASVGDYVWGELSSPVTVSAYSYYHIGTTESNGGDTWANPGSAGHDAIAGISSAYYGNGACNTTGSTNASYGPVAFKYVIP